ncbi:hypothetical protein [Bryocella elongata]|nr:hypothetical protein [Bryocella elongata]
MKTKLMSIHPLGQPGPASVQLQGCTVLVWHDRLKLAHTKVTCARADRYLAMYDAFLALSFAAMIFTPAIVAFHVSRNAESHLE